MSKQNVKVGTVHGDLFGIGSSGVVAKTITGNVHVGSEKLSQMPGEYSQSLQALSENINQLLQKYQVDAEKVAPVQKTIDEMAEEVAEIGPETEVDYVKQISLKAKLVTAAAGLAKLLPKGAEVVAAFTPLAPFSKLIGEAVDVVVKNVVKA
jgi:hypothetical protein